MIATGIVGADGRYELSGSIPPGIELGDHLVQVNGVSKENELRSISIKVILIQEKAAPTPKPTKPSIKTLVIGFKYAEAKVLPKFAQRVSALKLNKKATIKVTGYAEPTNPKFDGKLARKRAEAVGQSLAAAFPGVKITVSSNSKSKNPLCTPLKNRCAVISIRG